MRNLFLMVLVIVTAGCGVTERVEIIREMVGCTSDAMCADRDDATTEYCEVDSGICVRERVVTAVCETFADCDDGDMTSVDSCDADGVCNHTRDITAPFDPASPERQDAYSLCEHDLACPAWDSAATTNASLIYSRCSGERDPWNENGYTLLTTLYAPPADLRSIFIRPQMRVGDPSDLFRVTVEVDWDLEHPAFVREMTGLEVEAGLTVPIAPPTDGTEWWGEPITIRFEFADPIGYRSRSLQWALPPGGVTDPLTDTNYNPCLQVGRFMVVPEHGFLHLEEGPGGEPVCNGAVRGSERWTAAYTEPSGLFRSVSDPTLYYASTSLPRQLIRFGSLREFIDWFRFDEAASTWHITTICANVAVFEDSVALAAFTGGFAQETVGVRPGTPVSWTDTTTLVRHYGFADRFWTIRDLGTVSSVLYTRPGTGVACSWYTSYIGGGCEVELDGYTSSYTIVPADPATIDPHAIDRESGWLFWYNHEMPTGP